MASNRDPLTQLIDPKTVALVVLDLQSKLIPAVFESERLIRNTQLLLRLAQVLNLPVVLTSHYPKGLGSIVPEIVEFAPGITPLEKTSFGCFGEPGFIRHLKERAPQANSLVMAGVESHICVTQTVLGALEAGYLVHVAADATSSRTRENWHIGLNRMERAGAVMSSTEMIVYELLRVSGTPEFKAILPMLK